MCAPKAPSPTSTANAQTASNQQTAITQAGLNAVNQVTPDGSLTYDQIGQWSDGTPRYQATQALSEAGKQLQSTTQATSQNLANVAREQSGRLSGLLNAPNDFSAQRDYLNNLTNSNLDPMWARQGEQFETSLVNRGIRPGSTAYQQQLADFQNNKSSSYNAANLNNFTTAQQSQSALRAGPLNEILALAGQGQIQQPNFASTPQTSVAGTDVAGITNGAYQQQMQGYQAGQQQLGGLFSAGASLIPLLSDRRAKTDIKRIGTADNGLGLYLYRYRSGGPFQIGVMADEVKHIAPHAVVIGPDDFMRVNYSEAFA